MKTRVYEIERGTLSKVKSILEARDKSKIETKCQECGKTETKNIDAEKLTKDYEKENPCSCGGIVKILSEEFLANEFAKNGYILRDARVIEVERDSAFLYIKAEEDFFNKNESLILIEDVKKLEGEELEKIKNKIEEQEDKAAEAIGGIFNL